MKLEENIEKNISKDIDDLGFEIEYVEYVKEGSNNILRVVIDKLNSTISVDDCELISRKIEDIVDKLMPSDKEYILEVSSAGLERQLKNVKLYKKYINSNIHIKLYKKIDIGKEFDCILVDIDELDQSVTVKVSDKILVIDISEITNAHTIYDYDKLLKSK